MRMDELNAFVILAGVLLIFGALFWAGFTDLWSRLRGSKRRGKRGRKKPVSSRP